MGKSNLVLMSLLFVAISCNKKDGCENPGTVTTADGVSAESCSTGGGDQGDGDKTEPGENPEPLPEPDPSPGPVPEPIPAPVPLPAPEPVPVPAPVPAPLPLPTSQVPHEALIFDARVALFNFDDEDEAKVAKAIEIIKKVVGSKEFMDKVINFTYAGKKQYVDNSGLTNTQIYQALLKGKEDLKPVIDHEMDLELELYSSWRSTVGYTYPDGLRIWMNTKFFYSYTPSEVAGNIFHEWTHKLGFDHDSSYSVSRDSSVPYALGYMMETLGEKYE